MAGKELCLLWYSWGWDILEFSLEGHGVIIGKYTKTEDSRSFFSSTLDCVFTVLWLTVRGQCKSKVWLGEAESCVQKPVPVNLASLTKWHACLFLEFAPWLQDRRTYACVAAHSAAWRKWVAVYTYIFYCKPRQLTGSCASSSTTSE